MCYSAVRYKIYSTGCVQRDVGEILGSRYNRSRSELHTTDTDLRRKVRMLKDIVLMFVTHESAIANDAHTGASLACPAG